MDSATWINYLSGGFPGRYQSIEKLILFRDQIPQIVRGLKPKAEIIADFLARVYVRVEFDIIDRSFSENLRVYSKMAKHRVRKPERPSVVKQLFREMDIVSRVFMAKVELSYSQMLLTCDPRKQAMAECFGLYCELR